MAGFVRVRPASKGGPCAVQHPEHGDFVVPNPAHVFHADDSLVRAYPWLFVKLVEPSEDGVVEQATRAPGDRRNTRRSR